jgi:hypothetical protein
MGYGIKCSGTRADGQPCRQITLGTITVQGVPHAACPPHQRQVLGREVALAARKITERAGSGRR